MNAAQTRLPRRAGPDRRSPAADARPRGNLDMTRPDTDPVPEHVDAVIRLVAVPRLAQLAEELRHPLSVSISLLKDGSVVGTAPPVTVGTRGGPAHHGELRLVFRRVFDPDMRLFVLDGVFPADDRTPSFSGFSVQGHVKTDDGTTTTHAPGWEVHWNSSTDAW
jgi:hypothetical protein